MMNKLMPLAVVLTIAFASVALAQDEVVFVVRHAERADGGSPASGQAMTAAPDPALSAVGEARATALAKLVRAAGIKYVYATEFRRTQQTAQPAAAAAGAKITVVPAKDTSGLIARLQSDATLNPGAALVVGHSNTVPDILQALGVTDPVAVADDEYDNLFVVVRGESGPATLVVLKY